MMHNATLKTPRRGGLRPENGVGVWTREIVGLVASIVFLVSMCVLLAVYDGKPIFSWHGVSLNAVVSVLSTASRGALLYAAAEAIGQWKWILFSRQRRILMDFERIDSASRGLLGSFYLLFSRRVDGA